MKTKWIDVVRYGLGWNSTLSKVSIGKEAFGFVLEDECRSVKVPGETCIPEGEYQLGLRKQGAMHTQYSALYPKLHKGMLWLLKVPDFEFIYFHRGNTEKHTRGCLITGTWPVIIDGEFEVRDSANAYERLYERVAPGLASKGEDWWVRVTRRST